MIRILLLCPNPNDGTSYYRGIGPFMRLQKDYRDVAVYTTPELDFDNNWSALSAADIVILQRPFHNTHVKWARAVRRAGIPLWVDYDDDHLNLAFENPAYDLFMNDETRKNTEECLRLADVVTVSTQVLKDLYGSHNSNVIVIPNAIDDAIYGNRPSPPRKKLVVWRGGQGHERDLDSVSQDLIEVSHDPEFADWTFHFVGARPWRLIEKMRDSNTHWSPGEPVMTYLEKLWQMRASVVICPLVDDAFNRAKSNIVALEALYAGALPVVPMYLREFAGLGLKYGTPGSGFIGFKDTLIDAMEGHYPRGLQDAAWQRAKEVYSLSTTNHTRNEIITALYKKGPNINWETE